MVRYVLLSIIYFSYLCNFAVAEAQKPVLGVSVELTGEAAAYGLDLKDILIFANEKLANNKYELDFQDNKCDPKASVDVAKYFTELKHPIGVIGFGCSGAAIAAAPIFEKAKLLTMVTFASSPKISTAGSFIFRSTPNDRVSGSMLGKWVVEKKLTKVGVLSAETDYCQDIKEEFLVPLNVAGITIFQEDYLPNTTDYKPLLLKLKRNQVEGIFLNGQGEGSSEMMLKDLAKLQWKPKLFGAYFPSSPALLDKARSEIEGTEFVDLPSVAEIVNADGAKLFEEFKLKFGMLRSVEATFVTVFEGFRALHQALQSNESAREYLLNTKFSGITGDYSFDRQGQIKGLGFVIKKIQNGKVVRP